MDLHGTVEGYSFESESLTSILEDVLSDDDIGTVFSMLSGYSFEDVYVRSIQQNFLNITNLDYYIAIENQEGSFDNVTYLSNGQVNVFDALYNFGNNTQLYDSKDPYDILIDNSEYEYKDNLTYPINVIVPEGWRLPYSIDTETPARLCI